MRCNIYDMIGNVDEWSTETSNYNAGIAESTMRPATQRGGDFSLSGSPRHRKSSLANSPMPDANTGFRGILYL